MRGVCSVPSSESCCIPLQAVTADKQPHPEVIGSAEFGGTKCDTPVLERLSQLNLLVITLPGLRFGWRLAEENGDVRQAVLLQYFR